jgi:hypothetical protein
MSFLSMTQSKAACAREQPSLRGTTGETISGAEPMVRTQLEPGGNPPVLICYLRPQPESQEHDACMQSLSRLQRSLEARHDGHRSRLAGPSSLANIR